MRMRYGMMRRGYLTTDTISQSRATVGWTCARKHIWSKLNTVECIFVMYAVKDINLLDTYNICSIAVKVKWQLEICTRLQTYRTSEEK
jgi:hypothetical protein